MTNKVKCVPDGKSDKLVHPPGQVDRVALFGGAQNTTFPRADFRSEFPLRKHVELFLLS